MEAQTPNDQMLIAGIEPRERLFGAGAFGDVRVVVDKRFAGLETERIGRILSPASDCDTWLEAFSDRLKRLIGRSFLSVSLPLEAHTLSDGRLLLLEVQHQQNVDAMLGAERGLGGDAKRFDLLADQLLTGLAELHSRGISHGDIRPRNLFLDTNPRTRSTQLWIVDAAIGPLTYWSGGQFRDPEAHLYLPPEQGNRNREPCPMADVYAVGLSLTEMILGREAIPGRNDHPDREQTIWKNFAPRLKEAGASRPLRQLLKKLLADEADRPPDAVAAVVLFEGCKTWQSRFQLGLGAAGSLLVGIVVTLVCLWLGYRSDLSSVNDKLVDADKRLALANEKHNDLQNDLEEARRLRADIAKLGDRFDTSERGIIARIERVSSLAGTKTLPVSTPSVPTITAKAIWNKYKSKSTKDPADWLKGLQQVDNFLKSTTLDDAIRKELNEYRAAAREILPDNFTSERRLDLIDQNRVVAPALETPWDMAKTEKAVEALARRAAERRWNEWAQDESLDEKAVENRILLVSNSREQKLLKDWWDKLRSKQWWTVVLVSGKCKSDWGRSRRLSIDAGYGWYMGSWHEWTGDDPKDFQYQTNPKKEPAPEKLDFCWKPGHPLHLVLRSGSQRIYGGLGGNIIDHTINGPFAPWRLHDEGGIDKNEDELKLQFEVDPKEGFPGPPTSGFKKAMSSVGT